VHTDRNINATRSPIILELKDEGVYVRKFFVSLLSCSDSKRIIIHRKIKNIRRSFWYWFWSYRLY